MMAQEPTTVSVLRASRGVLMFSLLALATVGCSSAAHESSADRGPLVITRATVKEAFPGRTGIWHYKLRYAGINEYSPPGRPIHVFDVLAQSHTRTANSLSFTAGGPLPLAVGAIVECELPAEDVGFGLDAPVESYAKRPASEVFASFLPSGH